MTPEQPLPFNALMQGWLTGASLIMAIGAQNALVLRQGLMRSHVAPVVFFCTLSDVLLICLGVFGLGAVIASSPLVLNLFRWGGAVFLILYGLRAAQRAWVGGAALQAGANAAALRATLLTAAALTFLNPHVYLDTVVLLGTLGAQIAAEQRWAFALGASLASLMWFSLLGFGAAAAADALRKPWVWRAIDAMVAVLMLVLGLQLALKPVA
ncbi:amino acid transporter [Paucibacter sp. KBW04]|nr:amino acid transporter [Paucibacter sp. KBW04]